MVFADSLSIIKYIKLGCIVVKILTQRIRGLTQN